MLKYFEMFVNFLWGLPIIVIILGAGIYFTFKTGFFQVFYLKHIFSETILKTIKTGNKGEGNAKGLITPFDAVATAIGGTVGVGNIGGVATAIAIGGPGALFWLWIAAFLGMMLKTDFFQMIKKHLHAWLRIFLITMLVGISNSIKQRIFNGLAVLFSSEKNCYSFMGVGKVYN